MFHRILFLFGQFSPGNNPCLDQEQNTVNVLQNDSEESQSKRPRQIVIFPVWHEISSIGLDPENDEGQGAQCGRTQEKSSDPTQHLNSVILIDAHEIHDDHDQCQEHADETETEEELGGHEEGCNWNFIVSK